MVAEQDEARPPSIVLIVCDDLGYGDLGAYGSEKNRTPHLDRMAREGVKLVDFYATASVCTPSRASIMTGCYPQRVDMAEARKEGFRSVLLQGARHGLNPSEITLAEALKPFGYATMCIGKWHLGDQPKFLPTRQGFDRYFGIPYSNNMDGKHGVPLMRDEVVIEQPVDQSTLTARYTEEAIDFMEERGAEPFFIYLAHTMPHTPLFASERFAGRSPHGLYSDVVEEIDWSVGRILDYLVEAGLDRNTLVFFTSDNGGEGEPRGSNRPLRGGKGQTWEGGMRVPALAWWPESLPSGRTVGGIATVMDFLPTFYKLASGQPFDARVIDGHDLFPLLSGAEVESPYSAFYYYDRDQLQAVRSGPWKLHLPLENRFRAHYTDDRISIEAELYHLEDDVGESTNLASERPEVVAELMKLAEGAKRVFGEEDAASRYVRPAGRVLEGREPRKASGKMEAN